MTGGGIDWGQGIHQTICLRAEGGQCLDVLVRRCIAFQLAECSNAFFRFSKCHFQLAQLPLSSRKLALQTRVGDDGRRRRDRAQMSNRVGDRIQNGQLSHEAGVSSVSFMIRERPAHPSLEVNADEYTLSTKPIARLRSSELISSLCPLKLSRMALMSTPSRAW